MLRFIFFLVVSILIYRLFRIALFMILKKRRGGNKESVNRDENSGKTIELDRSQYKRE